MSTTKYIINSGTQSINGSLEINGTLKSNSTGVYRALLTQTGQIIGNNMLDFNGGLIVGETYTITSYVDGDDFSNIADIQSPGTINATNSVFIATGQIPENYSNSSELTSDGGLIVDVLENTLGYDLDWYWSGNNVALSEGNYVAFNNTTAQISIPPGPIYNSFQRDKIEIVTPFKWPFNPGMFPPFITPNVGSFASKDDVINISVINVDGGPGILTDDLLYYTPIEIKINQDTDTTPVEIYGEVIPSFPFSDAYISLIANGNYIQDVYCDNIDTVNNISELLTLLNNDNYNVYGLIYSEGGPGGIKLIMPTNIKNQFCSNGTLTFEVYSND
jgi:hypothetical protein